jgi:hypothetical protein
MRERFKQNTGNLPPGMICKDKSTTNVLLQSNQSDQEQPILREARRCRTLDSARVSATPKLKYEVQNMQKEVLCTSVLRYELILVLAHVSSLYLTPPKGLASCIGKGIATERRGTFTCQCRCLKEERPKSNTEQILISAHAQGCELQQIRLLSIIPLANIEHVSLPLPRDNLEEKAARNHLFNL